MSILIYRRRHHTVPPYLQFTTQPGGANSGSAFSPQPVVTAKNPDGTTKTSFVGNVTLAVNTTTGSHALGGTVTVAAVAGVATFSGVTDTGSGDGTLTATATGYSSATSASFTTAAAGGVTDTFTRTGSSLGTADSGQAWTQQTGAFTTDGANANQTAGANAVAVIDSGLSNGTVTWTLGMSGALIHVGGVVRWVDANNYISVTIFNGNLYVQEIKAGAVFWTSSGVVIPGGGISAPGDSLQAVLSGSSITTKYNGTTVHSALTVSDFTGATKHGLYAETGTTGIWQGFSVA